MFFILNFRVVSVLLDYFHRQINKQDYEYIKKKKKHRRFKFPYLKLIWNKFITILDIHADSVSSGDNINTTTASNKSVAINIEATENTPLLKKDDPSTPDEESLWKLFFQTLDSAVYALLIILLIGGVVATYLLIVESQSPRVTFTFDLVSREAWGTPLGDDIRSALNPSKVSHIVILHTGGKSCRDADSCEPLLAIEESHRSKNVEIPHNFMIGGDGQTYEVRGWDYQSGFSYIPKDSSLVIGLIGNFTEEVPPIEQLDAVKALITESLRRQKLQHNYQLYGVQNITLSHRDGACLFDEISQWENFDTMLRVL